MHIFTNVYQTYTRTHISAQTHTKTHGIYRSIYIIHRGTYMDT